MFTLDEFPDESTAQRRLQESHRRSVLRIDRARVPVYGLPPSWRGERATGNTQFSTGVTRDSSGVQTEINESIELMHLSGQSSLRVESSDQAHPAGDDEMRALLDDTGVCDAMTITMDGTDIAFARATSQDRFAARWVGNTGTVTVLGERWPTATGLELVRIHDFSAYHEGRLRKLEERSGLNLRD